MNKDIAAGALTALLGDQNVAYIDPHPNRYAISPPFSFAWATVSQGGWFDGVVYLDQTTPLPGPGGYGSNKWDQSSESHIGPGGRRYHTYRNVDNGRFLSQTADLLWTDNYDWADTNQWWSVEHFDLVTSGFGRIIFDLLSPWSIPDKVVTIQNGGLYLSSRVGTTGSQEQRVEVRHRPYPPF